ncbi:uncharacterized protein [Anoplolepis gracilipes]|uniref:uncharacterized protein n=1 Tax=Anoplolepis gracilipes TaxID=354296 RepID=UPI003BA0343C
MVYVFSKKYIAEDAIKQLKGVESNLKCILNRLLAEQDQYDKSVKDRKCRLRNKPIYSYEYFLSKNIMCLDMAHKFYEWNKNSRRMFGLLILNMDIYTRLKVELQILKYNANKLAKGRNIDDRNFVIINSRDIIYENGVIVNMDASQIHEFEDDEAAEFYIWINKINERAQWLIDITVTFNKIRDAFFTRCFSLYQLLNDYCKELGQYLHNNKDNLKLCKFYREKNLAQHACCKYHFLKQLLMRVSEEKKHCELRCYIQSRTEEYVM